MYDPNNFVLGTKYDDGVFRSIQQKNPAKKLRMESERLGEIQRTNKILFDRMIDIAKKPHFSTANVIEP